jgi:hypothetical protein
MNDLIESFGQKTKPRRVGSLKSIAQCKQEMQNLVAGGGVVFSEDGKMVPMSEKAKHIVQHMFSEFGRTRSEIWAFLADEADWRGRVVDPQKAAAIFEQPSMSYAVRQVPSRPVALSRTERQFDPSRQRPRKSGLATAGGRR